MNVQMDGKNGLVLLKDFIPRNDPQYTDPKGNPDGLPFSEMLWQIWEMAIRATRQRHTVEIANLKFIVFLPRKYDELFFTVRAARLQKSFVDNNWPTDSMYRLRITSNQATSEPGNESSEDRKACLALSGTRAGSAIWEILSDHILELGPEPKTAG